MQAGHESLADYQEILSANFDHLQEVSSGGGGIIIKAHHKSLDKDVIIKKVIRDKVKALGKTSERDALKNLKHAYLPQIYDYIERGDDVFTVMEYIPGQSFATLLKDGRQKFSKKDLVKWTTQLLEVVTYLHSQKPAIIHCDIKPGNVMLTPEGNICLIDFNISSVKTEEGLSSVGYTPEYAPAEQYLVFMRRREQFLQGQKTQATMAHSPSVAEEGATEIVPEMVLSEEGATEIAPEVMMREEDATEILQEMAKEDEEATEILTYDAPAGQGTSHVQPVKNGGSLGKTQGQSAGQTQIFDMLKKEHVEERIDERTDIYSVGATLYHIATGVKPKAFFEKNVPLQALRPDLPDGLLFLITKAMQLRPQDRFKNGEEALKVARRINKLDKRYQRVNRMETLLTILFGVLMILCIIISIKGWNMMGEEKLNSYQNLVAKISEARFEGNYENARLSYEKAIATYPNDDGAYYEMALFFYENQNYERCLDFVMNEVFPKRTMLHSQLMDRFDYMVATSYFMLGDYKNSISYYEEAISYHTNDELYYRDYVIALARMDETKKAREVLEKAKGQGVVEAVLLLLEGEISYMEGDADAAERSLCECVQKSKDPEVLLRAYVKLDDIYKGKLVQDYDRRIASMEEAVKVLPEEYRMILMERLAQAYMDCGDARNDRSYHEKALEISFQLREQGFGGGSLQTDYNIAVLYVKLDDQSAAIQWLEKMIKERGEDYRWYKMLAFVELDRQSKIDKNIREYGTFLTYYQSARRLYENAAKRNTDQDMMRLEEGYRQLINDGWLEE